MTEVHDVYLYTCQLNRIYSAVKLIDIYSVMKKVYNVQLLVILFYCCNNSKEHAFNIHEQYFELF